MERLERKTLRYDLGSFTHIKNSGTEEEVLTGQEVLDWHWEGKDRIEIAPSGDNLAVARVFKGVNYILADDLMALDNLLEDLGGDGPLNYFLIYVALEKGELLHKMSAKGISELHLSMFFGASLEAVRENAAETLLRTYFRAGYSFYRDKKRGFTFNAYVFLKDSPSWDIYEMTLGKTHVVGVLLK